MLLKKHKHFSSQRRLHLINFQTGSDCNSEQWELPPLTFRRADISLTSTKKKLRKKEKKWPVNYWSSCDIIFLQSKNAKTKKETLIPLNGNKIHLLFIHIDIPLQIFLFPMPYQKQYSFYLHFYLLLNCLEKKQKQNKNWLIN